MKTKRINSTCIISTGTNIYNIKQDKLLSCMDVLIDKFTELSVFLNDIHENDYEIFDTINNWSIGKIQNIHNQLKYIALDIENLKVKLSIDDEEV